MERTDFERIVEQAFDRLPDKFKQAIENLAILVEDYPTSEMLQSVGARSKRHLLGLYHGIPLTHRNTWYGTTPTPPDQIFLFQRNIEDHCHSTEEIEQAIYDVLIHEIGHYFGMSDEEIRQAGY
jgi:predicted Zn-dependent protease with MMP-like domain